MEKGKQVAWSFFFQIKTCLEYHLRDQNMSSIETIYGFVSKQYLNPVYLIPLNMTTAQSKRVLLEAEVSRLQTIGFLTYSPPLLRLCAAVK